MPSIMLSSCCHQALEESPQAWGPGPAPLPCLCMDINIQLEDKSDSCGSQVWFFDCHLFWVFCAPLPRTEPLGDSAVYGAEHRGTESIESDGPIGLGNLSHPRVSRRSVSSGDQVVTQILHVCFCISGAEWRPAEVSQHHTP